MHSPGPFRLGAMTPDRHIRIDDANGWVIGHALYCGDSPAKKAEQTHNATLFRIAPELAELLGQAIDRGVDAALATRAARLLDGLKD